MVAGFVRATRSFAATMKRVGNVVQAAGESLTLIGEHCFAMKRIEGEADADYRERVTASTKAFEVGQ